MSDRDIEIKINVNATEALADIERIKAALDTVPDFEVEELEELTWHWPYWILFATSIGGGLTVLLAFWLVATVVGS